MDRYTTSKQIGDGTYGCVMKAVHKQTQEVVAIKRMKQKFFNWEDCINLREVQVLRKLNNHPNIVRLREVIREHNQLFFVFECMDSDLLAVMKEHAMSGQSGLPQAKIRNIMYQMLQAVAWMHRLGYMHRDLKPENLLLTRELTKLADFGLAKEIRARPPFTEYVSTRWYRAPEVLLQHKSYNSPIDVWAAGCIMAELYTLRPLFPGKSEPDELFRITSVLGTPDEKTWPEGLRLAKQLGFKFPQMVPTPLKQLLPTASAQAISLMNNMLQWDPEARSKASELLQHPFFQVPESDTRPVQVATKQPHSEPTRPGQDNRFTDAAPRLPPAAQARPETPPSPASSASSDSADYAPPLPPPPPVSVPAVPERRAPVATSSPVGRERTGKSMLPSSDTSWQPALPKVPTAGTGFTSSPNQAPAGPGSASSLKNARYVPGVPIPMPSMRKVPRPAGGPAVPLVSGGIGGAAPGSRGSGSAGGPLPQEAVPSTGLWKWGQGDAMGAGGAGRAAPSRLPPYNEKPGVGAGMRQMFPHHSRLDPDKRGLRDLDLHK